MVAVQKYCVVGPPITSICKTEVLAPVARGLQRPVKKSQPDLEKPGYPTQWPGQRGAAGAASDRS
jgi:hypothetical protein